MIDTMVVLGAGGDLTGRLLLPALATLRARGELGPQFRLVGAGLQDYSHADFAEHARGRLADHAASIPVAERDALVEGFHYRPADVTEPAEVAAVLEHAREVAGPGPVAVYLALPTALLVGAVRALTALPPGSRVAIEKPFGQDTGSAAELNAAAAGVIGGEHAIYRVDHALAMTAVQQLPQARHPRTGEPLDWSSRYVSQLDLLWEETLALEGRAAFYDRAGALRDVVQNHLVQVLCTIAADHADTDRTTSARRADVLRSLRSLSPDDVRTRTRRARYTAGRLAGPGGRPVPDYVAEDGVDPARHTETFAEVVLELDDPRWAGTRFVLRAGKALNAQRRGVVVHAREAGAEPLWLDLDAPQRGVGESGAYEGVLADLLGGGTAYAVGADEAELAWQVFTPVLRGWTNGDVELLSYPAGSSGPRRALSPASARRR